MIITVDGLKAKINGPDYDINSTSAAEFVSIFEADLIAHQAENTDFICIDFEQKEYIVVSLDTEADQVEIVGNG